MKITVAITGASGCIYGLRLLDVLKEKGVECTCIVSDAAKKVIAYETDGGDFTGCLEEDAIDSDIASGSFHTDAMVVVPCSMKTLSALANGYASNIITRAGDVMIKERKKLVIVPREMPLSQIHLENMLKLSKTGAIILPAAPGFYHRPKSVEDLVDFVVGKILDALNIENELYRRWGGGS